MERLIPPLGYNVTALNVPEGLHLKSGMTCFLPDHFIIQKSFESLILGLKKTQTNLHYFVVPDEEHYAANVLPLNGKIMIPAGCPVTKEFMKKYYAEKDIFEVDTSQARLVDGALTCSCLLFK